MAPLGGFAVLSLPLHTSLELPTFLLGSYFALDKLAFGFLLFSSVVWGFAVLFGLKEKQPWRFWFFFLLTLSGNLGLCVAQDAASFYLFFALMTFGAYPLIITKQNADALFAGKIYLIMALFGEMALLVGLFLSVNEAGGHAFEVLFHAALSPLSVGFLLVGFGVKVGVFGLHVWLPLAHSIAPTPASAVLSGVMLKAGVLGWVRFIPFGQLSFETLGMGLALLGTVGLFGAVIIGLAQKELKTVLAYSSVSQMGVICIAMGLGLQYPKIWEELQPAVVLYIFHHAFVKAGLFFVAGIALHQRLGAINTILGILLGLALCGAPLSSGAVAKSGIKEVLLLSPRGEVWEWVLFVGAGFSTVLLVHFFVLIHRAHHAHTASPNVVLGLCVASSALVAGYGFDAFHLSDGVPLLLGLGLYLASKHTPYPPFPKGDLLHLIPRFELHPHIHLAFLKPLYHDPVLLKRLFLYTEERLARWEISALVWIGLACVSMGLMAVYM
jgi:formate hydrogenlyase subunit 3/multisubunit Na+/H+ antiporter MnhD subunit